MNEGRCEAMGAETIVISCDVSVENDCKRLVDSAVEKFKTIHVLINNAGISMRAVFADVDLEVLKRVMDINFWGTVYCTKFALPYLLKNNGSVIGVSSVAGIKGLPGRTGYSASKFAMNGFMESLRIENLKTGLHVGVICPGYTASNIRNTALDKAGRAQMETPLDESKLMPAEDVAAEILQMVMKRKSEKVLTGQGISVKWMNKFFPRWLDKKVFESVSREPGTPFK